MKRKWVRWLLALAFSYAAFGFAGCGEDNSGGGNNPSIETPENPDDGEETPEENGLAYTLINGGAAYEVSGMGNCTDTDIIIPARYRSLPVTTIGDSAFRDCRSLESVTFGENSQLTSIGDSAFRGCDGLTSINIPDNVTSIGGYAFAHCDNLTNITIPNSVTSIGDCAFSVCDKLQYNTHDNGEYLGNENNLYMVLVKAINTDITSCAIHDDTKIIHFSAFNGCGNLTNITIPNSVTSIGSYAFSDCDNLTSIEIPGRVTSIGSYAFSGCDKLQYNTHDNGEYLGNENNLYMVLVDTINTDITSCAIHGDTKFIHSNAFSGCSSLESITIPDNVTSIGDCAFEDCSSLESIIVDKENTVYNSEVNCLIETASKTLVLGCQTSVIPTDGSVTCIGNGAFYGCSGLTSIEIPDRVTSIGNLAFYGCSGLTSIEIPDRVTSIGNSAFYGCSGLTSITIPDSVTTIGELAFDSCYSLEIVYYGGTSEQWGNVDIDNENENLTNATRYYYSETQPTDEGNYWYYDENGVPTKW